MRVEQKLLARIVRVGFINTEDLLTLWKQRPVRDEVIDCSAWQECRIQLEQWLGPEIREDLVKNHSTIAMEEYLRTFVQKTPLEILATFLLELKIKRETAVKLFSSYNAFLALLDDAEKRERLKKLSLEDIPTDAVFGEVRADFHMPRQTIAQCW